MLFIVRLLPLQLMALKLRYNMALKSSLAYLDQVEKGHFHLSLNSAIIFWVWRSDHFDESREIEQCSVVLLLLLFKMDMDVAPSIWKISLALALHWLHWNWNESVTSSIRCFVKAFVAVDETDRIRWWCQTPTGVPVEWICQKIGSLGARRWRHGRRRARWIISLLVIDNGH